MAKPGKPVLNVAQQEFGWGGAKGVEPQNYGPDSLLRGKTVEKGFFSVGDELLEWCENSCYSVWSAFWVPLVIPGISYCPVSRHPITVFEFSCYIGES